MALEVGGRIGPYQLVSILGTGGMGKVYRARDATLNRDVAVKVLAEPFTGDADRLARFLREAQLLASLNHPHIAAIYGVEKYEDGQALVLELVDGPTVADRCVRGPLPIPEAIAIARQITEALEAAHEKGIVHRDLKPANIAIDPGGRVKVLDFGLAKLAESTHVSNASAEITHAVVAGSSPGLIVGTAAYMAPEQVRGEVADRSCDVWAFGCVLFETLTGRPAFAGATFSDIIGEVLKSEPDWSALPAETPETIRRLLRRCLQKDRRRRLRDIADARLELEDIDDRRQRLETPAGSRRPERALWLIALVVVAGLAAWLARLVPHDQPVQAFRLEISTPPSTDPTSLSISADGRHVAFSGDDNGASRLWVRTLDAAAPRPLAGTTGGYFPFWSPDNRSLAFFADGKLKRIDIETGSVQTLDDATAGRGGAWLEDGAIIFAPQAGPIYRIPATGGSRVRVTPEQSTRNARFPQMLPDGRHFVYYSVGTPQARGVYIGDLDGTPGRRVVDADGAAVYSASGHLMFVRQRTLFSQRFDANRLELVGDPVSVSSEIAVDVNVGSTALSASRAGALLYRTGLAHAERQLAWVDRSGAERARLGEPDDTRTWGPELSPDGRTVAITKTASGNQDIWLLDLSRQVLRRFTSDDAPDANAVWSPDGRRVAFTSSRTAGGAMYVAAVSGDEPEHRLVDTPPAMQASDWSRDGRYLLFRSQSPTTRYDIWAVAPDEGKKAFPVVQTAFDERDAQFSPDGKWIAFESNESGRFEIYVQAFPGPGRKWPISPAGGAQVRWSHDGRELFYIAADRRLMSVPITLDAANQRVDAGAPKPLFTTNVGAVVSVNRQQYTPSPDGQRFLMNTVKDERTYPITVLLNWRGP